MRLKRIIILMILVIFFWSPYIFSAEPQIIIAGEQTAKPNETKVLTIKISSETEIGLVSGKIEANENITNINVTGKYNWNLTFNKDTGVFNIYKAEGSKAEEIISIEYTTANKEETGRITLSNLKMTTIEYETKNVSKVVKEITIKNETSDPEVIPDSNPTVETLKNLKVTKAPTKTTYTEGEKFNKAGMIVTAEYSDGTSKDIANYTYTPSGELKTIDEKIIISYTEEGITKTVEQDITVKNVSKSDEEDDSATQNNALPNTGIENNIVVIWIVIVMVSVVSYFGYTKYKDI